MIEQRGHRDGDAERPVDLSEASQRDHRAAAELEEVVADADRIRLQARRPDARELELHAITRRRRTARGRLDRRRGQRLAIELAGGGERQRIEHHERGGHHVTGQMRSQRGPQIARRRRAGGRHDVRHQALVARRVLAHDDGHVAQRGMLTEHRLDLAQLDPDAADLHLLIEPPHELENAGRAPAQQIAGAVQALALAERTRHEALRRQPRLPQVAARDARSADESLARHEPRHRVHPGVEDVDAAIAGRCADRHRARLLVEQRRHDIRRAEDRALRWSVAVDDAERRHVRARAADVPHRRRFAAGQQGLDAGQTVRIEIDDRVEDRRRQPQRIHAVTTHVVANVRRADQPLAGEHTAAAGEERRPELQRQSVPAHRGVL